MLLMTILPQTALWLNFLEISVLVLGVDCTDSKHGVDHAEDT